VKEVMRKLLYILGGVAFGVVIARIFRRSRPAAHEMPAAPSSSQADALRAQLAASRSTPTAGGAEPPVLANDEGVVVDVDEARRRVHGRARDTVDEMRRSAESG
jgi:hypothetical protein